MAHRQQLMADRTERAAIPYRTDQRQITMLPLFRFEADKRVQDPDPLNFKFFLLFFFLFAGFVSPFCHRFGISPFCKFAISYPATTILDFAGHSSLP